MHGDDLAGSPRLEAFWNVARRYDDDGPVASDSYAPGSAEWRADALSRLLRFAEQSAVEGGFAWLDGAGEPDFDRGMQLWINARMTYVFALAGLWGWPGGKAMATHGVRALLTTLHDPVHGGWFDVVDNGVARVTDKSCYNHSFALLAGSVAASAGVPGGTELFEEAAHLHRTRFWDEDAGCCRDTWDRSWSTVDRYRGANGNMHALEAYLFAHAFDNDETWLHRGLRIAERICRRGAGELDWRVPEHFDSDWRTLRDHNKDRPADPFKPYGATPGHAMEWARLLIQLEAHLVDPPPWLFETAARLFNRAARDNQYGVAGFCYTTDWSGQPVVVERFHWVHAEAIAAADCLARRTRDGTYRALADRWWRGAARTFMDRRTGSWHHEIDADGRVSNRTWDGKPDAYHVFNVLTLPELPLAPTSARALASRRGGAPLTQVTSP